MEILFNYNGVDIVYCEKQKDGMYKLGTESGNTYLVFKEEIKDNL